MGYLMMTMVYVSALLINAVESHFIDNTRSHNFKVFDKWLKREGKKDFFLKYLAKYSPKTRYDRNIIGDSIERIPGNMIANCIQSHKFYKEDNEAYHKFYLLGWDWKKFVKENMSKFKIRR